MTTRNLLLAGTIIAGPLLSVALPSQAASNDAGPALRLAQAEPGGPGERRERGGPGQAAPQAPPQREAPPPREAPPQRAAPPAAAQPAPRAEPPQRPQAAPERREAPPPPQAAPERREPRAEPPRERPQSAPDRREAAPERREAPQPPREAPRAEPPRPATPPVPPSAAQPRPDAPPAERRDARPDAPRPTAPPVPPSAAQPRPDAGPAERRDVRPDAPPPPRPDASGQRPAAPAVPPSATQPRPDLGGRPDAQQRPGAPGAPIPTPQAPPVPRSSAPDAPPTPGVAPQGGAGLAPPGGAGLAPPGGAAFAPQPRGDGQRAGDRGGPDRGFDRGDRRVEERDGRTYIREDDNRLIVREGGRDIIRHDEVERLRRGARDVDIEQRPNGRREIVIVRPDGDRVVTIVDADGNLLRRERRGRDGRTFVLIDNDYDRGRDRVFRPVELPPLRVDIPRERYIVEAEDSSYDVIEDTFRAPPVERVERPYSLDEVRYNQRLREKVRRVDVDTINFEFGSAAVDPNGAARLETIARAINDVIRRNPNEVFLVEGHTDAVGADTDNLTLSDRRAESVASILTDRYQIPPENLVSQGYGEQFLKVPTQAAERQNRRVTIRRITPLLQQGNNQAPPR